MYIFLDSGFQHRSARPVAPDHRLRQAEEDQEGDRGGHHEERQLRRDRE